MGLVRSALGFLVRTPDRSALKTADGVPPPPDMAQAIREHREGRPATTPPVVDKTKAPASIDFVEAVKQQRGGK